MKKLKFPGTHIIKEHNTIIKQYGSYCIVFDKKRNTLGMGRSIRLALQNMTNISN